MRRELSSTDAQEKFNLARHFIKAYFAAREGLRELGILRSERNLQGDYAEWLVAQMLDLELVSGRVQPGYDAIDHEGRTYQIKCRLVHSLSDNTSFDMRKQSLNFDYLVGVFFSPQLDVLQVIRVAYETVMDLGSENKDNFRFRWSRRIASDPRVEVLFESDILPR